ncbi:hypothetical protein [Streptomyces sp. SP18CS02]|uniref:hypothetical protein n=1 Tax=Streptomyces sp. SP18CS02 TaxID=3002531 RepID=UPI002E776692|nr:hypothetical protein [Streptomyces sp. SP18CS02]MEE1752256.1 hypothetical protein [Streptomyces sp. SP18CS02]
MLTFDNVFHAPLDKMKAAVDDWSEMTTRLEKLAEDARTTMAAKAKDDYWRGVNAEITKPFVDKTAKEFDDAAKAAKGIRLILDDGHNAFKKARDDLKRIVDTDAPAQGLTVTSHGRVRASHPLEEDWAAKHDPEYDKMLKKQRAGIDALQGRIDAIIETCDDADVATSNALKANISADEHNFSAPKYSSLDAEEARRALDLAKKGGDLSHDQLGQLNELLKDNHTSKEFARTFYDGLGPKGSLEFFGQLSTRTYENGRLNLERLTDVQELQRNLGLNLASATQGGDKWTESWSTEMRKLGTERVPMARNDYNGPFGYQLLGGIMRYGNYDPKFLNPIAEHVVQLHQKDPARFAENKAIGAWQKNPFNPSGVNGAGYDPIVPMLEALGHSPEAAKQFFSATPTAYNEDGTIKGGEPHLGESKDGEKVEGYLDYFSNERYDSFPDTDGHHPDEVKKSRDYMPDALGHALEAATLGRAYDDPRPAFVRDATAADIMESVVERYGGDPEFLKKNHSALADSLGNMGAGYIDDINWALDNRTTDSIYAPEKEWDAHAELDRSGAHKFLSVLGQHPDAYASISTAERVYTTSVLEDQVGADGRIDEGGARHAVNTGAQVQGILDQSRADQVEAEGVKKHEDYEKAHAKRSAWIGFGTTAAIAAGVAFLPATAAAAGAAAIVVPLAVDTGSAALGQMASQVVGDWSDKSADDHKRGTEGDVREKKSDLFRAGEYSAKAPMERFIDQYRGSMSSGFEQDLRESVDIGYATGNLREDQQGHDPETG